MYTIKRFGWVRNFWACVAMSSLIYIGVRGLLCGAGFVVGRVGEGMRGVASVVFFRMPELHFRS